MKVSRLLPHFISRPLTDHTADARRYFKQSEIILYRQAPDAAPALNAGTSSLPSHPENKQLAAAAAQAQG